MLLSDHPILHPEDLSVTTYPATVTTPTKVTLAEYRARAEQEAVAHCLALTRHNVSAAARLLDISRVSLYRMMKRQETKPACRPTTKPLIYSSQQGEST
ncbi:helix-turn-helix domain-containing protein [Marinobacter caseinilyticus]|uniref:helix-turn-helix domain-containing protein n=1 Tax=Marinobacter caseinilyticus TaxID=2692195 RepID=UPI00140E2691|nr:helix-turn-helix domain-containing protein [Marinobacter caseinilyticus]